MTYTPPALAYFGPVAHDSGTGNLPPARIVIHCTAGSSCGGNAKGTAHYFQDPASGGSAHYVVDPNQAIQCAHDDTVCWHAPPNLHSLGIEIECSLSNDGQGHWERPDHVKMLHRAAVLTAQKCVQYGVPAVKLTVQDLLAGKDGICGHIDVSQAFHQSTHTDPGHYFPWPQFIAMVHAEVAAITGTTTPTGDFTVAEADRVIAEMKKYINEQLALTGTEGARYAQEINENRAQTQTLLTAVAKQAAGIDALTKIVATLSTNVGLVKAKTDKLP